MNNAAPSEPSFHASISTLRPRLRGFTLIELLVVISIMVLMLTLVVPAFRKSSDEFTKAVYDISGIIDNARAYAVSNHTYVFLGFAEVDVDKPIYASPQLSGTGRVVVAAVASKDGSSGYDVLDPAPTWLKSYGNTGAHLTAIGKVYVFENLHIAASIKNPTSGQMARFSIVPPSPYIIGQPNSRSLTPFSLPLGNPLGTAAAPGGKYYFEKVITFNPQGMPTIQAYTKRTSSEYYEISLQPSRGTAYQVNIPDPNVGNHAAILINGITGTTRVFRP